MRRWLVVPALLLTAVLMLAAPAALATTSDGAAVVVLAVEGEGQPQGPEPAGPNVSGNPAAPIEYDAPFTWAAAIGLTVMTVVGAAVLGGMYYLMVQRPRRQRPRAH